MLSCSRTSNELPETSNLQIPSPDTSAVAINVVENRSRITATVLDVVSIRSSRFYVRLQVNSVEQVKGYVSFAEVGQDINAYPNFIRQEGKAIDYDSKENAQMSEVGNLHPGDQIIAEVYLRGPKEQNSWLMMNWKKR
jgi:hypothetical protein